MKAAGQTGSHGTGPTALGTDQWLPQKMQMQEEALLVCSVPSAVTIVSTTITVTALTVRHKAELRRNVAFGPPAGKLCPGAVSTALV